MKRWNKIVLICLVLAFSDYAAALPIDWSGEFDLDTIQVSNFRRTTGSAKNNPGSQSISDGDRDASFQTYLLRLNPTILVNDSASIKGEISTGQARGNFLGGNTSMGTEGNSSYYYTSAAGGDQLKFNQIYVELYADSALYKIGKFSKHFGTGAILNSGNNSWDRFYTMYDGFEAKFKLGNFTATPVWAKLSSSDQNGTQTPSGKYDVVEKGVTAIYENPDSNLTMGLYTAIREVESNNNLYKDEKTQGGDGSGKVTIIDIFFEKKFEKFSFTAEIPMISGDIGEIYPGEGKTQIDTNAFLFHLIFNANSKWDLGIHAGQIKGDDGETNEFEAMYLHPNYQIAEILFKYNYNGFNDPANHNIFQSSMTNTRFAKIYANYTSNLWTWKMAYIWARAQQVAEKGKDTYKHESNTLFEATEDQANDFGHEFDFIFEYKWNPSLLISGYFAYLFVGDYYEFTNSNKTHSLNNVYSTGLRLAVSF